MEINEKELWEKMKSGGISRQSILIKGMSYICSIVSKSKGAEEIKPITKLRTQKELQKLGFESLPEDQKRSYYDKDIMTYNDEWIVYAISTVNKKLVVSLCNGIYNIQLFANTILGEALSIIMEKFNYIQSITDQIMNGDSVKEYIMKGQMSTFSDYYTGNNISGRYWSVMSNGIGHQDYRNYCKISKTIGISFVLKEFYEVLEKKGYEIVKEYKKDSINQQCDVFVKIENNREIVFYIGYYGNRYCEGYFGVELRNGSHLYSDIRNYVSAMKCPLTEDRVMALLEREFKKLDDAVEKDKQFVLEHKKYKKGFDLSETVIESLVKTNTEEKNLKYSVRRENDGVVILYVWDFKNNKTYIRSTFNIDNSKDIDIIKKRCELSVDLMSAVRELPDGIKLDYELLKNEYGKKYRVFKLVTSPSALCDSDVINKLRKVYDIHQEMNAIDGMFHIEMK